MQLTTSWGALPLLFLLRFFWAEHSREYWRTQASPGGLLLKACNRLGRNCGEKQQPHFDYENQSLKTQPPRRLPHDAHTQKPRLFPDKKVHCETRLDFTRRVESMEHRHDSKSWCQEVAARPFAVGGYTILNLDRFRKRIKDYINIRF